MSGLHEYDSGKIRFVYRPMLIFKTNYSYRIFFQYSFKRGCSKWSAYS